MNDKPKTPDEAPAGQTLAAAPCSAVFTYDEVKYAICDACRLRIPDVWCDEKITHHVNGVEIPCAAIAWRRNREIHAKAHPPNDEISDR